MYIICSSAFAISANKFDSAIGPTFLIFDRLSDKEVMGHGTNICAQLLNAINGAWRVL